MKKINGGARPGAGRKKGSKWPATLAKELVREQLRQYITEHIPEMVAAQVALAKGVSYLVTRDKKTRKFTPATKEMLQQIEAGTLQVEVIEVWEKQPSTFAFEALLNRSVDRPKEQKLEVQVEGDWDKWEARLKAARLRGKKPEEPR